jgi:hypothetical protein
VAVGRVDQAALDLELGDPLDRIVLAGGQARRRPRLPVGRGHDQRGDEQQREDREA